MLGTQHGSSRTETEIVPLNHLVEGDVAMCLRLLNEDSIAGLSRVYTEPELKQDLLFRGTVYSYVLRDASGKPTDVGSFYMLETVSTHPGASSEGVLQACILHFVACTISPAVLLESLCEEARRAGAALVIAIDVGNVKTALEQVGESGSGGAFVARAQQLHYFLFNWQGMPVEIEGIRYMPV